MCNQFHIPNLATIQKYLKSDLDLPLATPDFKADSENVFPKGIAPVLLFKDDKLQLKQKSWGFTSPFDPKKVIFNARIERFYETKPSMWDKSFEKERCIIISDYFFETSKETYLGKNGKTYRQKYRFDNPNQPLTMIAGIYKKDQFSMVTTAPNSIMAPIHNRMPLIITPNELRQWLFQNFTSLVDRKNVSLQVEKVIPKN